MFNASKGRRWWPSSQQPDRDFKPEEPAAPQPPPFAFDPATCTFNESPAVDDLLALASLKHSCLGPQELWDRAPFAHWMLAALLAEWEWIPVVPESQLRSFTKRCLDRLQLHDHPEPSGALAAISARLARAPLSHLAVFHDEARAAVTSRGVTGLPLCMPSAAGALALWHATNPNPYEAAYWTAEFAALHGAFLEVRTHAAGWTWPGDAGEPWREWLRPAFFNQSQPQIRLDALAAARLQQAGELRTILRRPFSGIPIAGEIHLQDNAGFCRRCGPAQHGSRRVRLSDVRYRWCQSCGAPMAGHRH